MDAKAGEIPDAASTTPGAAAMTSPIRILIADADANFTSSLRDYLAAQPNFSVVARTESVMDALAWCEELRPRVMILDWQMLFAGFLPGELTGPDLVQKLKALPSAPAIIVASRFSLDEHRRAALAAGADEFMAKARFPQLIRPLIQRLATEE